MGERKIFDFSRDVNAQTYEVELDGDDYVITMVYSPRYDGYRMSIYTTDGDPLLLNQRVVYGVEVFPRLYSADGQRMPIGFFTVYDSRNAPPDMQESDLNTRSLIVYDSQAVQDLIDGNIADVTDPNNNYIIGVKEA